jgi:hypothetical protein
VCCATGREETIQCPLDCEYLRDAHRHEKPAQLDISKLPNNDIDITEEFLQRNEVLMAFLAIAVLEGAMKFPAATDWDVREALEALVQTYRTLQSGIVYEARPENQFAAAIFEQVQSRIANMRDRETAATGAATTIADEKVLGVLAFLQRLEYSHNNGRRRCRAFIDFLGDFYTPADEFEDPEDLLLEPEEPRIIL